MVLVVFALALTLAESNGQAVGGASSQLAVADAKVFPRSWVSDMFYEALADFAVRGAGTVDCQKHSDMYDGSLRNYTSWAIRSKYLSVYIIVYE